MKIDDIKELIKAFDASSATSFCMKDENGKIELKKDTVERVIVGPTVKEELDCFPVIKQEDKNETTPTTGEIITSPIVGVAYRAPEPGAAPFVSVGQTVKKGQKLCVIEAMKMFHDITAPRNGTILSILFEDGDLTEFGKPLFEIGE